MIVCWAQAVSPTYPPSGQFTVIRHFLDYLYLWYYKKNFAAWLNASLTVLTHTTREFVPAR